MRTFVVFLLCFAIALQGVAGVRTAEKPCPMSQMAEATAVDETVEATADCCNDAETAARTGKHCKYDMPCQLAGAGVLPTSGFRAFPPPSTAPVPALVVLNVSFEPSGVWRPPSLG